MIFTIVSGKKTLFLRKDTIVPGNADSSFELLFNQTSRGREAYNSCQFENLVFRNDLKSSNEASKILKHELFHSFPFRVIRVIRV